MTTEQIRTYLRDRYGRGCYRILRSGEIHVLVAREAPHDGSMWRLYGQIGDHNLPCVVEAAYKIHGD